MEIQEQTPNEPGRRRRPLRVLGRVVAVVASVAVLVAGAGYVIADWSRSSLDASARKQLAHDGRAGSFIETTQGVMHVRVSGPKDGPVVMLIHGGVVGGYGFENWREPLAKAGYRVVVPDLLGYGYSDRPAVPYTREFYMTQLDDLIDGLGISKPVNLVGASFGGVIVTEYTALRPERISSLALMAPAGLGAHEDVPPALLAPVIGDWTFRVLGGTVVTQQMAKAYADSPDRREMLDWMKEQTRFRGYGEALLASLRDWRYQWSPDAYRSVGNGGTPVFAAWGTKDAVHPYKRTETLRKLIPQTELLTLDGVGHAMTYGRAADILSGYLPFLRDASSHTE